MKVRLWFCISVVGGIEGFFVIVFGFLQDTAHVTDYITCFFIGNFIGRDKIRQSCIWFKSN